MQLHTGTSGFQYKEWKGNFYPEKIRDAEMLGYYAERMDAVEINSTFYRMPRSAVMKSWASEVRDGFRFVIKASQRITHRARLKDCEETLGYLWGSIRHLESHLGPVLFQLPPNFRADPERLRTFLSTVPTEIHSVLEFRHESWNSAEIDEVLRDCGATRCATDSEDEDGDSIVLTPTSKIGFARLRREQYSEHDLDDFVERLAEQPWEEAFVFFKHEEAGAAADLAMRLRAKFEEHTS